jgi:hypothetical protein
VQPRSYTQIVAFVERTLPYYEAALRKLEALDPPRSDSDAVKAWLAADRRVAQAVRDLGEAARMRDFPSVTAAAERMQAAGRESRKAAAGIGLHLCARVAIGR